MAKIDTQFMTKTAENYTLWSRTYLYSPYKGVPPPPDAMAVNAGVVKAIEIFYRIDSASAFERFI